ncbi:hypothetical protein BB560_000131 [Smittium megazygosporum]|uniref:Acyl-CoA dehydrogenase n=1 Tax=Smittium megazygosporum TaxID=133381 RepID=A0A2T9ZL81_9FUNG|nr:hypothetical protein BB560_000131 [Smittium megazygosporum]
MFPPISSHAQKVIKTLEKFVNEECITNEERFEKELGQGSQRFKSETSVVEELRVKAKGLGLWNLFLPKDFKEGPGFTNYEYAYMCEIMGRSQNLAPVATNCDFPDSGNIELLAHYGTEKQKKQWLEPLLEGKIGSAFAMTEPDAPSSDATSINCKLTPTHGGYLINGKKHWITNSGNPNLKLLLVMVRSGKSNEEIAESSVKSGEYSPHKQHSLVIVPVNSPGLSITRPLTIFGFDDAPRGHCEIIFKNVFIPRENMVFEEGRGFEVVQRRLGPARLHHTMRAIGTAERALELLIDRALKRKVKGVALADMGVITEWIGKCRVEIESARLFVLNAAHTVDIRGSKAAKREIAMTKVHVLNSVLSVIDRAIQLYGASGLGQNTPLPEMFANIRSLKIADGPDEVHLNQLGKNEIKEFKIRTAGRSKL